MPEYVRGSQQHPPPTSKSKQPAVAVSRSSASEILRLQRTIGNHAVLALAKRHTLPISRMHAQSVQRLGERRVISNINSALMYMPFEVAEKDFKLNDEIPKLVATLTTKFEEKAGPEAQSDRSAKMSDELTKFCRTVVKGWESGVDNASLSGDSDTALAAVLESAKQFFEDVHYWKRSISEIIAEYDGDIVPNLDRVLPLIEATMKHEVVPATKRIKVECTMGQGVVGSLKHYILYSDQFSSCSPVAMYGDSKGLGGLFHYAAGGKGQLSELETMAAQVNPTWIGITKRPVPGGDEDFTKQTEFFNQRGLGDKLHNLGKTGDHLMLTLGDDLKTPVVNEDVGNEGYVNLTRTSKLPAELKPSGLQMFFSPKNYAIGFSK